VNFTTRLCNNFPVANVEVTPLAQELNRHNTVPCIGVRRNNFPDLPTGSTHVLLIRPKLLYIHEFNCIDVL
jgi:hypothetical protein